MIETRKHTTTSLVLVYTAYGRGSAKVCLAAEWHNLPLVCFCFVLSALSINVSINLADVKISPFARISLKIYQTLFARSSEFLSFLLFSEI